MFLPCSGLIVLILIFMAIRVYLLRRSAPVTALLELNEGMGAPNRRRQPRFTGVPEEVIATFPAFKFEAASYVNQETVVQGSGEGRITTIVHPEVVDGNDVAAVDGAASSMSRPEQADDKEAPQCSVCIGDFEEGDVLRRLPCMHVFHQSCIDPWMTQHSTCPNCRWVLFSPPPPPPVNIEEVEEGGTRRWARNRGGSRVVPIPPPGGTLPASDLRDNRAEENDARQGDRQLSVTSFNVMAPAPFIGREVTHQSLRETAAIPPVGTQS